MWLFVAEFQVACRSCQINLLVFAVQLSNLNGVMLSCSVQVTLHRFSGKEQCPCSVMHVLIVTQKLQPLHTHFAWQAFNFAGIAHKQVCPCVLIFSFWLISCPAT